MPNQELVQYIKDSLAQNVSRDEIKRAVLEVGWKEADIATAFLVADGGVVPVAPEKIVPRAEPVRTINQTPEYSAPSFAQPAQVKAEPINFSSNMGTAPAQTPRETPSIELNNSQPISLAQPSPHHGTLVWVMGAIIFALLVAGGIAIWVVMNNKGAVVPQKVVENVVPAEQVSAVVVPENNVATSSVVVTAPVLAPINPVIKTSKSINYCGKDIKCLEKQVMSIQSTFFKQLKNCSGPIIRTPSYPLKAISYDIQNHEGNNCRVKISSAELPAEFNEMICSIPLTTTPKMFADVLFGVGNAEGSCSGKMYDFVRTAQDFRALDVVAIVNWGGVDISGSTQ